MAAQILSFPNAGGATISPIACFLRIGEAHRKLADLHAAERLPARRVVIDASRFRYQRELISALRETGAEIVLDTEAAELASLAKCGGRSRHAPWAPRDGGLLGPDYFRGGSPSDSMGKIAAFAVEGGFNRILAPTHYLGDPHHKDWLALDREACLRLRTALDREGGHDIAIDYPVIVPHVMLNDTSARGSIIGTVADLPIENVWIRASGLGGDAGPLTLKRYLAATSAFHNLGRPIIADHLGGVVAMAALAFGAVSGVAQGVGERERFDAASWHNPPPARSEDAEFGRAIRVGIPGLYRSATLNELAVLASTAAGRRLISCGDRECCPHGYDDMVSDPRRHAARQLFKAVSSLEAVPDLRRESYFLDGPMAEAERTARQVRLLRPSAVEARRRNIDLAGLMNRFRQHSHRMERLLAMLDVLHQSRGDEGPRALPVQSREPIARSKKDQR